MSRNNNNPWSRPDFYARQAKKDHYPARSVYKLMEIQKKYKLLRKGDKVVDLGCAPGSWLLYAAEVVGDQGTVTGMDLTAVTIGLPPRASAHVMDMFELRSDDPLFSGKKADVVLSDMAPSTTGHTGTDAARSQDLAMAALTLAGEILRPGGNFVCKLFQGEDFKIFTDMVKKQFNRSAIFKPASCRKDSRETYIIGLGKKEPGNVRS
ncbi:MAG: RlmE family RNA methyltransferase [Thermodesulfobacteriota bacterium]